MQSSSAFKLIGSGQKTYTTIQLAEEEWCTHYYSLALFKY